MVAAKEKTPTSKKTTKKTSVTKKTPVSKKTASETVKEKIGAVEHQFDEALADTQEIIKNNVSPKTKANLKKVSEGAEKFATGVENIGEGVEEITDSLFPAQGGSHGTFEASYGAKVSRLFIFRFLRWIIELPVIGIWSVRYFIISVLHYLHMFVYGKRNKTLWRKQTRYRKHLIAWKSYFHAVTNARPDIIHSEI